MKLCLLLLISHIWASINPEWTQQNEPSNQLSVAQMQADINVLEASLTALHPGLYRYNTPQQIHQHFRQLRQQTSQPLPLTVFYRYLTQFTTKLHCGHTYPNPFNLTDALRKQLFSDQLLPLYFRVCGQQWIVSHDLTDQQTIKPGDRIHAINQIPVSQITDSLLTVSRSDGQHSDTKRYNNLQLTPASGATYALFDQYFLLFFPTTSPQYTLTVQTPPSAPRQVTVTALTKAERHRRFEERFGVLPQRQATWQYASLDDQTGYLRLGDLAVWGWSFDARRYLDSVFTDINQRRYTRLIVDIRGCEGGDDDTRNELLSYLMKQPFGCQDPTRQLYRFLTVPDTLLPYLQTWDPRFKQPKSPADYTLTPSGLYEKHLPLSATCQPIGLKPNRFIGKICLLIDGANSSTTFTLADWFQRANTGRLVGSPTGGTKQGLNGGQFFFLHLPASGLEVDIPLVYQAPSEPQADQPVYPDRWVKCKPEFFINEQDAVLEAALQELSSMK